MGLKSNNLLNNFSRQKLIYTSFNKFYLKTYKKKKENRFIQIASEQAFSRIKSETQTKDNIDFLTFPSKRALMFRTPPSRIQVGFNIHNKNSDYFKKTYPKNIFH